jgi:hypothetical protein
MSLVVRNTQTRYAPLIVFVHVILQALFTALATGQRRAFQLNRHV